MTPAQEQGLYQIWNFLNKIVQYAEGIAGAEQFAAELRQLERMLSLRSKDIELSRQIGEVKKKLDDIDIERTSLENSVRRRIFLIILIYCIRQWKTDIA